MHLRRLAAVGAAVGVAALGIGLATPANAAVLPKPDISATPNPFKPGGTLTITVTECTDAPKMGANQIFATAPSFTKVGTDWKAPGKTLTGLKGGQTYKTTFTCTVKDETGEGEATFGLTTTLPKKEEPKFSFGRDDIDFSTTEVRPGGNVTIRVTCPSTVSSKSDSFAVAPDWKKIDADKNLWEGKGVYKQNLPKVSHLTITCAGFGSVPFTTESDGKNMGGSNGNIPSGPGPATGDGSLSSFSTVSSSDSNGSGLPLIAGGSAAALAAAGLGVVLVRRRNSGQEQA